MGISSTAHFIAETLALAIEHVDQGRPFLEPVAAELVQHFHGRTVALGRLDPVTDEIRVEWCVGEPPRDLELLCWAARTRPRTNPLVGHWLGGGSRTAAISQLVTDGAAWRHSQARAILMEGLGHTEMAGLLLGRGPRVAMLGLTRDVDFHPAEVEVLRLLEPGLVALHAHCERLSVQSTDPAAVARAARARAAGLTSREAEVLGLLAEGITAATIGHRLDISVRTVHRHLQSIYTKLGTHDRLTTVLVAESAGLLRRPAWPGAHNYPFPQAPPPPHTRELEVQRG